MYMEHFDQVIEERILANNDSLYANMTHFLGGASKVLRQVSAMVSENKGLIVDHSAFNVKKEAASQIPTCLVITSSESASSIETQFETVAQHLEQKLKSINVVLDEKKCGNMKQTIDFIQEKLRAKFQLNREDVRVRAGEVEKFDIYELPSSDDELREGIRRSNIISSIQEPSFFLDQA